MERTLVKNTIDKVGETVRLKGWIHQIRKLGKVVFIILRDDTGLIQMVAKSEPLVEAVKRLGPEFVIEAVGEIQKRAPGNENKGMATGEIELMLEDWTVISKAEIPPFVLDQETEVSEETRLKYRYLDLRRERLHNNIKKRHQILQFIRHFLTERGFIEIETPILSFSTPEGARDYLVPARNFPGHFYALPQSPQQYKQLLMVASFEKYFQIARCFRDEDLRGDRQPEFTQLDMEMSFVDEDAVMDLTEELFTALVKELFPEKKITQTPWPRLTYEEAVAKYGADKFDIRENQDKNELGFAWVNHFPMFEATPEKGMAAKHHPFTAPLEEDIPKLKTEPLKVRAHQYDLVLNGDEMAGGSIRTSDSKVLKAVLGILGHKRKEIEQNFGHLLEAFKYGVPPHGGIAVGLDRLIAKLLDEPSIREVIAFPKTAEAREPMTASPRAVNKAQLTEIGLALKKRRKNLKSGK